MMQNETSTDLDKVKTHIFGVIYIYTHTGLREAWETHGIDEIIKRGDEMKDLLEEPTHSLPSFIPVHVPLQPPVPWETGSPLPRKVAEIILPPSDGLLCHLFLSFFSLSGPLHFFPPPSLFPHGLNFPLWHIDKILPLTGSMEKKKYSQVWTLCAKTAC